MKKIVELLIDWDNIDFEDLGVDIMSLVDKPAIQTSWLAFAEEEEYILSNEEEVTVLEYAVQHGEDIDWVNTTYIDITQTEFNTIGSYLKGIAALDILNTKGIKKNEPGVTKYRYSGPSAQRNFCKTMLRLNKLYTYEEIKELGTRFGMRAGSENRGSSVASNQLVWQFKGGVNCKHYWEEVIVFKGDNNQTVLISKGPVQGDPGEVAQSSNNYWRFSDEDQRIITGPAMIPDRLILRRDELGNPFHVYFSKDTIKKINEKFLKTAAHNTDINHNDDVTTQNTLLESWIVDDPQFDKSTKLGFDVPEGTWMVSYRINDETTWNKIKNGELNGFSVTGNFIEKLQK